MVYDCLIIGYNDMDFGEYVTLLKSMGEHHPDYRDLNLNFISYRNRPYRALDIFTEFYYENKQSPKKPFHNAEVLWMVIMYLGSYLEKRGMSFDYINLFQFEKERLKEKLKKNTYLTIVITTTVYNFDSPVTEVLSYIKRYNTTSKIIVGGPLIMKRYERTDEAGLVEQFKYIEADVYIFSREGEHALWRTIDAIKRNRSLNGIPNVAYKEGNTYKLNAYDEESNPLDENRINYSLFPKEDVGEFINIRISKGCPYKCAFCGFPTRSNKYSYLDVEHIRKEMTAIKEIGSVKTLFFTDDTVNVPKRRFKELLRMMIKERFGYAWNCFFRCDHLDEETVALMKEAGCEGVFLGLESVDPTILKNMNKSAGKEYYEKAIPLFKSAGMIVFVSIFVGFPGETVNTLNETIDFLRYTKPDFYRPQLWYCDPVTPIWNKREQFGLEGYSFGWRHSTMDVDTACDLLEACVLKCDEPIWVPDPGYNFISAFIMRQRGISFEQQKQFLKCFNAAVKEKLLFPYKEEPSDEIIRSLKTSCLFDENAAIDLRPVHLLSEERYGEAEHYLMHEFGRDSTMPHRVNTGAGKPINRLNASMSLSLDHYTRACIAKHYDDDLFTAYLTAFSVLLNDLHPDKNTDVLVFRNERAVYPLRLKRVTPDSTYEALFDHIRVDNSECTAYSPFAMKIMSSTINEQLHDYTVVDFSYGYAEQCGAPFLQRIATSYPETCASLHLVVELRRNDVGFLYTDAIYSPDTITLYKENFCSILGTMSTAAATPIKNVANVSSYNSKLDAVINDISAKEFNF